MNNELRQLQVAQRDAAWAQQMGYRQARERRRVALANMTVEDRAAWLASADLALRLGKCAEIGHELMSKAWDPDLDLNQDEREMIVRIGMGVLAHYQELNRKYRHHG